MSLSTKASPYFDHVCTITIIHRAAKLGDFVIDQF